MMQRYRKSDVSSGVVAYEICPESITVEFKSGSIYLYDRANTGKATIETMKQLAAKGQGLSSYIIKHVHHDYAKRLK